MPKKPKQNDLSKLWGYIKKSEPVQNLVNSAKNTRKGKRPRVSVPGKSTADPEISKVTIVKDNPLLKQTISLPEFKPYYISDGNPNVLTPAQQEMRSELIKSRQIDLAKYQRELANRGINTPASHRRAGALAVATNPDAIMAPQEGLYKRPYVSAKQEWEGAPLGEWFEMASEGFVPYGPNALWRKWYQPLHDATNSFDIIGQLPIPGQPAPEMSIQQLGFGLEKMKPYLKKTGGVLYAESGIHIKKKNRGKFTSWCGGKVTSECIARGKASSNPAIRKRATFAANARKWKHKNGGTIPFWVHNILGGE